ncbi:MAG TPA: hypothetical protein VGE52_18205, partial [Pirellulales bacterium]
MTPIKPRMSPSLRMPMSRRFDARRVRLASAQVAVTHLSKLMRRREPHPLRGRAALRKYFVAARRLPERTGRFSSFPPADERTER